MSEVLNGLLQSSSLSQVGRGIVQTAATPKEALEKTLEQRELADAIYLLAHCLPLRQKVWWASLCVWRARQAEPTSTPETNALRAAVFWAFAPSVVHQTAAQRAAIAAGISTPAGAAALAAHAAGHASSPDRPVQPVSLEDVADLAASSVFLAAARIARSGQAASIFEAYSQMIAIARKIMDAKDRWDGDPPIASIIGRLYA